MKIKKHFYLCTLMPPAKIGGGRPRYYLIRGTSAKKVHRLFTRKLCEPPLKRKFNKEFIHDGYYYYDGLVYVEKLMDLKKVKGLEDETIYSTGYLHELCRECVIFRSGKKKEKEKKRKKKKRKMKLVE